MASPANKPVSNAWSMQNLEEEQAMGDCHYTLTNGNFSTEVGEETIEDLLRG
jgi:hypothetical protein